MKIQKTILSVSLFALASNHLIAQEQDIETIEVKSTYSSTDIRKHTSNVASLDAEQIAETSATHITEVLQQVPGTWISRGNGQEHLTAIRSPVLTGAGSCGAFVMAEDGIGVRASGFCNTNQLFAINSEQASSIEVLRGPNSVFYGSNAVHGVINVFTPDVGEPDYLGFEIGPHEYQRVRFYLSSEVSESGFAVYGNVASDGGYKDNSGFGQEKLNLVYQDQNNHYSLKSVLAYQNLNQETAGFIQGFEAYKDDALRRQNPNPEAYRDAQSVRWYANWQIPTTDKSYWSITPYFRHHDMTFLQHFVPWQPLEENRHFSTGLKGLWSYTDSQWQADIGVETELTDGTLIQTQDAPFAPHLPASDHYDFNVNAAQIAAFVNMHYQLSESLSLESGLRLDNISYDYDNRLSDGSACAPEVSNCRFTRPTDAQVDFSQISMQLGMSYRLDDANSLFANWRQGFRAPQVTELFRLQAGQTVASLEEEQSDSIEVGIRSALDNASYEITAYYQTKDNYIFQDTQRQNISNGETEHRGIEFAGVWNLTSDLDVRGVLTWSQHEYSNDIQISASSIKGNEIDTSPELIANVNVGWQWSPMAKATIEWQYMDEYFLDPGNSAKYKGHQLVNLRQSLQLSESVSLHLRVLNVLDQEYAERADFAFGNYRYFVGEPRSVYAGIAISR